MEKVTHLIEQAKVRNYEELNLSGQKIQELPSELFELKNLKRLILDHNPLISLPSEISTFPQLELLSLAHVNLTELPCDFSNLSNLRYLDLSHNQIVTFPFPILQLRSLEQLILHHNLLRLLPSEISDLTLLEHLDLHHNQLIALYAEVLDLEELRYLDIYANPIRNVPTEILLGKKWWGRRVRNHYRPLKKYFRKLQKKPDPEYIFACEICMGTGRLGPSRDICYACKGFGQFQDVVLWEKMNEISRIKRDKAWAICEIQRVQRLQRTLKQDARNQAKGASDDSGFGEEYARFIKAYDKVVEIVRGKLSIYQKIEEDIHHLLKHSYYSSELSKSSLEQVQIHLFEDEIEEARHELQRKDEEIQFIYQNLLKE